MFLEILTFLILYFLTQHILKKIRNLPPTPFPSLPILGHLYLLNKKIPLHQSLAKLSRRYGPVLLLHLGYRPVLVISSPSAAEECFTKNDIVFANRPRLLAGKYMGFNFTSLAWASYGNHWRNLRKIASLEILSTNRLQLLSGIRSDEAKLLVKRLVKRRDESDVVDMKTAFFELMVNVLMRMIAGKRYYGDNVEEVEEAKQFREMVTETFRLSGASTMADFLPILKMFGKVEKEMEELQNKRTKFIHRLIDEHKSRSSLMDGHEQNTTATTSGGDKNYKTMIEILLSSQASDPDFYKDEIIRSLPWVLLAAGTDTSASTMEWAMSFLLNHPEILKKAQNEIDTVVGHDRLISESDLSKLPYLNCIIKETLRIKPTGPLLVPHESAEECSVQGYRVPQGTMLLVNLWAIHNDPKYWEDANKFKPERFEDVEGVRDGFKLMPFGSGRRGCPGEGLALRMVGLGLGSVIQCFDLERRGKELEDLTEGTGLTMPKAQPLFAKCILRPSMADLLSKI